MKDKPIKFGIKLWGLAEASCGYLIAFDIYCGKEGNKVQVCLATFCVLASIQVPCLVFPNCAVSVYYFRNGIVGFDF